MLPSFLEPYKWLIYAAIAAAALGAAWRIHHNIKESGREEVRAEVAAERVEALEENSRLEAALREENTQITGEKDAKIRTINARLADALERMHDRSEERRADLPGNPGACQGGTGAGLSRPDAAFLERLAARSATILAERDECYRKYDAVRNAQPQPAAP